MSNEEQVYNAIKSGAKSHSEIKQKLDLSMNDILIYTAKLEQKGYIFQLSQGYFYITSTRKTIITNN